ncbi:MAG: 3-methyl-2-oxobutanoate hydroxymethyltransferase [Xanthomonadales bacterium]|nr:3-methyl-2-oxobutanoate hydroxymethyltransferase [Xanthomonadales bacterium]
MTQRPTVTVSTLQAKKQAQEKITMLTAYDASFAALMDKAGIDCILVGDSLGNVIHGAASTLGVSVDDVVYHCRCVASAINGPLLVADMPFMSYHDRSTTAHNAHRLIAEGGASMVKLEGGGEERADTIHHLCAQGMAVCGHLGLTPQWVHRFGGFKVQGRSEQAAQQIETEAHQLAAAGIQLLVLEGVPAPLAQRISELIDVPVIGIGAGVNVDGQVLVLHDMLGMNPRPARFVRDFLATGGSIEQAFVHYIEAVRDGSFPAAAETYQQ